MKQLFTNEDGERAVSPVIGVILMVAITVILAAVIASFVLGLGDADDPAPNPTTETDFSSDEIVFDVTGGDDFDAGVSEIDVELVVFAEDGNDNEGTVTGSAPVDMDDEDGELTVDFEDELDGIDDTDDGEVTYDIDIDLSDDEEVTAGDQVVIEEDDVGDDLEDDSVEIVEYDIEIIWDPADQDSEVIASDSGSS